MATLRDIKQRITSIKNTSKITQAMRMVAAAKLRRAQEAITAAKPFANQLQKILANLAASDSEFMHPYFESRPEVKSIVIVVISSDRGLCGGFNANLLRVLSQRIANLRKESPTVSITLIPVGKRAVNSVSKGTEQVLREFPDVFMKIDFSTAVEIVDEVSNGFLIGKFDRVEIIHNEFHSIIKQEVRTMQLLPFVPATMTEGETSKISGDYIFEPTLADILDSLLPKYLNMMVWKSLLDSNAAEQAARMMAMENATNNARDLVTSLQLIYNRERQAAITKEMLEIVGGAEALSA